MRVEANSCDRCGALRHSEHIQRTAHIKTERLENIKVIDHSDLELCPLCAATFNDLLTNFLENK